MKHQNGAKKRKNQTNKQKSFKKTTIILEYHNIQTVLDRDCSEWVFNEIMLRDISS